MTMMTKPKRIRTEHKGIYFNEKTEKYDVKACYTAYDPASGKNVYRQKWAYNVDTMDEALSVLAGLREQYDTPREEGVTLSDALNLWESKANAQNLSPVTIANTHAQFKIICRILPPEMDVSQINEDVYYEFASKCRSMGYSDETIAIVNASLRKLINLCYRKRLIRENVLDYCDNIRTTKKCDYRTIPRSAYHSLDTYFAGHEDPRADPVNCFKYRLLLSLLYHAGIRIGEAMALTYEDLESCSYVDNGRHVEGTRLRVNKSYVSRLKLTKVPKNYKSRHVPLPARTAALYAEAIARHLSGGGIITDRIFTMTYSPIDKALKRACAACGLPAYTCHEFRHTYVSYLISRGVPISVIERVSGDTQQTILSRYSHCFADADSMVWSVVNDLDQCDQGDGSFDHF